MQPKNFEEANKTLLKPNGMTDKECGSLAVYCDSDNTYCLSCWKPSLKERISILMFGRVWLWVMGSKTQPPVSLEGTKTVFE